MSERLVVVIDARVVAVLERRDDDRLRLTYTDLAIELAPGRALLSASLPVRRDPYEERELVPFFDGLLPEELVRQRLAARLRIEPGDTFGLLREVGRECAGAFSVLPENVDPIAAESEGVAWLSEPEVAATIRDLAARPLGIEPDRDIRISLAGAQDKLVVVIADGRIGLPRGTTPSTHILKPASQMMRGRGRRPAFPDLVLNEAFCMRLAELSGLNVPPVDLGTFDDELVLIVRRYDREPVENGVRRIHQEDFCQASDSRPAGNTRRTAAQGFPSISTCSADSPAPSVTTSTRSSRGSDSTTSSGTLTLTPRTSLSSTPSSA